MIKTKLKRQKVLAVGIILALTMSSLSGCKKDDKATYEELEVMLSNTGNQLTEAQNQVESLKQLLYTYDSSLSEVKDLSTITQLPTGKSTYTEINNSIILGPQLEVEPSMPLPNNTTIELVPNVIYKPSNNWSFNLTNGNVSLVHKNGMYVTIRSYNYLGNENAVSAYDAIIKPYTEGKALTELNRKSLFLDNTSAGVMATYQCYVSESTKKEVEEPELERSLYDPNAETEVESEPETYENGVLVETEVDTSESDGGDVAETAETQVPKVGLSDLIGSDTTESTESTDTSTSEVDTSGSASDVESTQTVETDTTDSSDTSMETQGTDSSTVDATQSNEGLLDTELVEENEDISSEPVIKEYRYIVGLVMDNSTVIVIEAFYPQDENASIQEELFETCLNSLYVRDQQLKSQ